MRYLAAILVFAASASAPSNVPTLWSDDIPPPRFQGETAVEMIFLPRAEIQVLCDVGEKPPPDRVVVVCTITPPKGQPIVLMPLPCPVADRDYYARIVCHELAHVRGWPATHGG